jgi:hypothetical protein
MKMKMKTTAAAAAAQGRLPCRIAASTQQSSNPPPQSIHTDPEAAPQMPSCGAHKQQRCTYAMDPTDRYAQCRIVQSHPAGTPPFSLIQMKLNAS